MLRRLFFNGLFVFTIISVVAQQQGDVNVLELKQALKSSNNDTSKVNLLLQVSDYYFLKNPKQSTDLDTSMLYANNAEALSNKLYYEKGLGNSYEQISKIFHFHNDTTKGKYYANKAIEIFKANSFLIELGYAYYDLSGYYSINSSAEIIERIRIVEQLALPAFRESGSKLKEADILKELGDLLQLNGDYLKALSVLNRSLQLYQSIGYRNLQGVYDLMGSVYSNTGNNEQALKYGLLAINTPDLAKDSTMQWATVFNRIGSTYLRMKKNELAYKYFQKALAVAKKNNDGETIVLLTSNISRTLIAMNKPREALAILLYAHQKYPVKDIYLQLYITSSFLITYKQLKQYKEAQKYCDQLLSISQKLDPHDTDQSEAQFPVIEFYLATHQYDLARERLIITDAFYKDIQSQSHGELSRNHLLWFKLDSAQDNYLPAIAHYQQYKILADLSLNEITRKHIEQLQVEYETQKKDKDLTLQQQNIQLLTKQGQLQKNQLQKERLFKKIILSGLALLVIVLALLYKNSQHRLKMNRQLRQQQAEIEKQNMSLQHSVKEKEWLVKEIHHRVKNNLQIVSSLMNIQSNFLPDGAALDAIKESQSRVNAMSLIHQKLYQSPSFISVNMDKYIKELVDYIMQSFGGNKKIDSIINVPDVELDVSHAVPIGLILNEAVTNSIKYAFKNSKPAVVKISLQPSGEDQWLLLIADNGPGLLPDFDYKKSGSIGMALIETLAEQLGGTLHFNNTDGLEISISFVKSVLSKNRLGNEIYHQ